MVFVSFQFLFPDAKSDKTKPPAAEDDDDDDDDDDDEEKKDNVEDKELYQIIKVGFSYTLSCVSARPYLDCNGQKQLLNFLMKAYFNI